jgi:hypothetical protein
MSIAEGRSLRTTQRLCISGHPREVEINSGSRVVRVVNALGESHEVPRTTGGTAARRTCNPSERQLEIQLERDRKLQTAEINGRLGAKAAT